VEQGRLELDKPLATYVPDFSLRSRFNNAAPITLSSIMTHHSGIPSDYLHGMLTRQPQPISSLPALIKGEYTAFPPNTVFSYSNLGMSLLGLVVQKVSGQKFASYMQQTLLSPLGMQHSAFSLGIDRAAPAARAGPTVAAMKR
jgi:CubicO group peptidase (beta-lactamase class C family)